MNVIIFLCFYLLNFFLGRGVLLFFSSNKNSDNFDSRSYSGIKYDTFYSIFSLLFFGNLLFIINFFLPLENSFYILFIFSFLLFLYNFKEKFVIKDFNGLLIKHLFIPIILSITTYGSWLHFDSGAYHLNYQYWLRTEKITFGLANLNFGYGFSSILEYLEAILWFDKNYLFIYFINLIFYCLLFSFIYEGIFSSNGILKTSSFLLLIFGILDNFGYQGGANGFFRFQAIAKPDMPFAIIFVILSLLIIDKISKKEYVFSDIKIFSIFSLFLFQIKLLGLYIGILFFYYLYKFYRKNEKYLIEIFTQLLPSLSLGLLWSLKNFILSGCLLFPIKQSCFKNVNWYVDGYINKYIYSTKIEQKAYFLGESFNEWFNIFLNKANNKQIFVNFLISIFLLVVLRRLVFNHQKNKEVKYLLFSLNSIYLITWLTSSPSPRWGAHLFPFLVVTIAINYSFKNNILKNKIFNRATLAILFLTIGMMPRSYSYLSFFDDFNTLTIVSIPQVEYTSNQSGDGFIVDVGYQPQQCWVNKYCLLSDKKIIEGELLNYKVYLPDGSKKW